MDHISTLNLLLFIFLLSYISSSSSTIDQPRQTYIIHMDTSTIPSPFSTHHNWYTSTLSSLSAPDGISPTHLYTYNHVMAGYSAVLSQTQLDELERMPGHIATYPDRLGHLDTTHSPQFLGLNKYSGLWPASKFGDDMIIGIFDTGVWPESKSFNDHDMPPVPKRWRGTCQAGVMFNSSNCNRKLIGARYFNKGSKQNSGDQTGEDDTPRDNTGHGTHTASIAAGSRVPNASYFGYAKGTAMGAAPLARLAVYRVLAQDSTESDILAGMDQAIEDGVDIMSLSIRSGETEFFDGAISIGAFAATEKGIFVACSAGNRGDESYTVANAAPWITTVASGTIDRDYLANVTLGKGVATIKGRSIFPKDLFLSRVPLYFGRGNASKEICDSQSLNPKDVSNKIVFCRFSENSDIDQQIDEVSRVGAVGAIFATDSAQSLRPSNFHMPFVAITPSNGKVVMKYITKVAQRATVDIKFVITVLGTKPAPQVAASSSRGPNSLAPMIMKPDILAPGVNILAAYVPNRPAALIGNVNLHSDYQLMSGTSMSTPHIAGIAALLKSVHKDWSPAAIRSAMMTTADWVDNTNRRILNLFTGGSSSGSPLSFGAGHVNPNKAMDPGLVYDLEIQDYINFLCGLNYTSKQIRVITRRSKYNCDRANLDLNYPSFIVILNNTYTAKHTFNRVLKNVADCPSVYRVSVWAQTGMKIVVKPKTLSFRSKYDKVKFSVTVDIKLGSFFSYLGNYGYLRWSEVNGNHVVTSPVVSAFSLDHTE